MQQTYIVHLVHNALKKARPEQDTAELAALVFKQARAAVNYGFPTWPWYRRAEKRIHADHGGPLELVYDVAALTAALLLRNPGLSVEEASFDAMVEIRDSLRREYDDARVPNVIPLDDDTEIVIFMSPRSMSPKVQAVLQQADSQTRELLMELAAGVSMRDACLNLGFPRSTARRRLQSLADQLREVSNA